MNRNELSYCSISENKLRKAFIHQIMNAHQPKRMERMKTKIAAAILALTALLSFVAVVAYAQTAFPVALNPPVEASWVRIHGIVTKWGAVNARGQLWTQARTALLSNLDTRQFARASAVWSTNLARPIFGIVAKENFTHTFNSAVLLNASVSTFSIGSNNFFLNGTWKVAEVTCEVTVITNSNNEIVSVHRETDATVSKEVYGELTVTDSWTKWNLQLTGYDPLFGLVERSVMGQVQFNWYSVTDNPGTSVTRADVDAVVQCYRAMPGWGPYNNRMDFNYNYKIDITDLATVAASQ